MAERTYVSSKSLIELQTELKSLSENLKELHETLTQAINQVKEQWQDSKCEEFEEEFRSSKEMVLDLSEKYKGWADSYLPPYIEKAIEYEGAGVSIK